VPTAHHRYFLKIYFLPELLGSNCVRSVLTDGRKKTDDNYLGETYKEDRSSISAIYYLSIRLSTSVLSESRQNCR